MIQLSHVHLPVRDLAVATAWYRDMIGFRLGYQDGSMVEFDEGLILDGAEDAVPGDGVVVGFQVVDADAVFAALRARGVAVDEPPTDQPWGVRSFYLRDPEGHRLEFEQRLAAQR